MGQTHREKIEQELWRLAQEILSLGLSVVLDFGLWARIERDEMRSVAREIGVGVELHFVDVPTDELWRRIEARNSAPPWDNEPIGRADLDEWLAIFQAPDAAELALFDPPPTLSHCLVGSLEASKSTAGRWHCRPPCARSAEPESLRATGRTRTGTLRECPRTAGIIPSRRVRNRRVVARRTGRWLLSRALRLDLRRRARRPRQSCRYTESSGGPAGGRGRHDRRA